ncbi:hypothetical protein ACFQ69_11680 [Streptomyces sp. NPDC056470]|uniref:hypothetical protein n=1 Tax=Streptomyces sp. NPDC056470 TaxID=3345831 RepID=UPI0036CE3777
MESHKLLGFHITTNPNGHTTLTLNTHDPESAQIYRTVLDIEPYVADALRQAVLREIPHRPLEHVTFDTVKQRLYAYEALAAGTALAPADPR